MNKFLRVENHTVQVPDGRIIHDWGWIDTPDFVTICAIDSNGMFICFKQTKYAIPGIVTAPPAGYIEKGEIPFEAARRELLEETGYISNNWTLLAECPSDANRGNGTGYYFLARNCVKLATTEGRVSDDLEYMELICLTRDKLENELDCGNIMPLPWLTVFTLGLRHIGFNADVLVIGALIEKDGKFLIAKRATGQSNEGMLEFPGGKPENGENETECLKRELLEELSIDANPVKHFGRSRIFSDDKRIELSVWHTEYISGEIALNAHSEILWISPDEMDETLFTPADRPFVRQLKKTI